MDEIDEPMELIVETIAVKQEYIRINKQDFPYAVVRSRFEKIHFDTMEYVLECMRNNTTKVRNIRSYMLTTLYNAPATCNNYYKAEVNNDIYNAHFQGDTNLEMASHGGSVTPDTFYCYKIY